MDESTVFVFWLLALTLLFIGFAWFESWTDHRARREADKWAREIMDRYKREKEQR